MTSRAGQQRSPQPVGAVQLPGLIRRYLECACPRPVRQAAVVMLEQAGEMVFKPGAAPRSFTAVEQFATDRVAFTWRARLPIAGPLALRVTDGYDGRDGLLQVRLLGLPLQRKHGPQLAPGEAFRYLAELPWMPHAILANTELRWHEVDARTVEVSTEVTGAQVAVRLIFNDDGEIEQTAARRPRLEAGGELTPWIGTYSDYRELGGARVPTRGEVRWELAEGSFAYWRGRVTSLHSGDRFAPLADLSRRATGLS